MAGEQKNRLILGCMNFGPDPSQGARVTSPEAALEILNYLKLHHYNELDTARIYTAGQSEAFLAKANYKALSFTLATKVYPSSPGLHAPDILKSKVAESLAALETEAVDIFYLHAADRSVPFSKTLAAVDDLHKAGHFKTLGLSNYTSYEVAEIVMLCRANDWITPSIYQAMYNPLCRKIEAELVPACRRYGLDIVVYNPLAAGLLTQRNYEFGAVPSEGRFSAAFSVQGALYRERFMQRAHFEAREKLQRVADAQKISLIQLALRWAVHHSVLNMRSNGGNDGVIVGVSSVEQIKENIEAFEQGPLTEETLEVINNVWTGDLERVTAEYWRGELVYGYNTLEKENW